MTPAEFRATLEKLGMRQIDAARLLGVGERTIKAWAAWDGDGVTNEPAARFLAYIRETGVNPAVVEAVLKFSRPKK